MQRTKFSSKKSYIEALVNSEDPTILAFVPVSFAAEMINVKRSTTNDLVRDKKLTKITIKEDGLKWAGIQIRSLLDYTKKRKNLIDTNLGEVRQILEKCAKGSAPIAYGALLAQIGMSYKNPQHRKIIGQILGKLSEETWEEHKFMLSVLAVNKSSGQPNDVFFELAEEFGAIDSEDEDECDEFFKDQLKLVYDFYQN